LRNQSLPAGGARRPLIVDRSVVAPLVRRAKAAARERAAVLNSASRWVRCVFAPPPHYSPPLLEEEEQSGREQREQRQEQERVAALAGAAYFYRSERKVLAEPSNVQAVPLVEVTAEFALEAPAEGVRAVEEEPGLQEFERHYLPLRQKQQKEQVGEISAVSPWLRYVHTAAVPRAVATTEGGLMRQLTAGEIDALEFARRRAELQLQAARQREQQAEEPEEKEEDEEEMEVVTRVCFFNTLTSARSLLLPAEGYREELEQVHTDDPCCCQVATPAADACRKSSWTLPSSLRNASWRGVLTRVR